MTNGRQRRSVAGAIPRFATFLLALCVMLFVRCAYAGDAQHPRLLGMNIGGKNYDDPSLQHQLARLDVVILGFYPGWTGDVDGSKMRAAVQAMKRLNPALMVGQ